VGGNVDKAIEALKMLQEFKIKHESCTNIVPQFIVFKHNQHEMEVFQELCRYIGLKPAYKAPYLRNQNSHYSLSDYPQFVRPIFQEISKLKAAMAECPNVKNVFTILRDGSVVICCHDYGKITCFGNIFEQSVEEIWNSHLFKKTRWNISSGNPPNFCLNHCMTWFLGQAGKDPYFSCDADMMGESEKDLTQSLDNSIETFVCNTAINNI